MLYEIDSFGFVPGFIKNGLRLMSEDDLKADDKLRKELEESQYLVWKRHNIMELIREYGMMYKDKNNFDSFCREIYQKITEKKNH